MADKFRSEAAMVTKWEGDDVKKGVAETKREVSGLAESVKQAATVMAGTFASAALIKGIELTKRGIAEIGQEMKRTVQAAGEAQNSQARLAAAMTAQGKSFESIRGQVDAASDAMYRYAGVSREEVTESLSNLVTLTGSVEKSMKTLPALYDFMAVSGMDAASAARMMAQAWEGSTSMLGRYIPALRGLGVESAKAGEFISIMAQKIGGQATAATNTYLGSIGTLNQQIRSLRVALGTPIIEALTPGIGKLANLLQASIERGDFDQTARLLGQIASNLMMTADALFGGIGGRGAIEGINAFLTKVSNYTGSDKFISDLQLMVANLNAFAGHISRAIAGMQKFMELAKYTPGGFVASKAMQWMYPAANASEGYAEGGAVRGPRPRGPGDNIIAPLRVDEYVLNANAVKAIGVEYLDQINRMYAAAGGSKPLGLAFGGSYYEWAYEKQKNDERIAAMLGSPEEFARRGDVQGFMAHLEAIYSDPMNPRRSMHTAGIMRNVSMGAAGWGNMTSFQQYHDLAGVGDITRYALRFLENSLSPEEMGEAMAQRKDLVRQNFAIVSAQSQIKHNMAHQKAIANITRSNWTPEQLAAAGPKGSTAPYISPEQWQHTDPTYSGAGTFFRPGGGGWGQMQWFDALRYGFNLPPEDYRSGWQWGSYHSGYPQFASGGIIPGPRGRPVMVVGHGGERIYQPDIGSDRRDPMNRLVDITDKILKHLLSRGESTSVAVTSGPARTAPTESANSTFTGRGIKRALARAGTDLAVIQEELEEVKKEARYAAKNVRYSIGMRRGS